MNEREFTPEYEPEMIKCDCCGEMVEKDDCRKVSGKWVCNDCIIEYYYECEHCGEIVHEDEIVWFDSEPYCCDCAEELFCECDDCGELMYNDSGYWTANGYHICDDCREHYFYCTECDELYHEDDIYWSDDTDEPYCYNCFVERRNREVIKPYHYKPFPLFYRTEDDYSDNLFMGVELEVDKGGEDHDNAQMLLDIMNEYEDRIYIKHDGSLLRGFEIVSHPCTLEYHCNEMKWNELMQKALSLGYRSHDTDTCGLHIHISRNALGDTYDEQDDTISKILYFIENNWEYVTKFTRRTYDNITHWANRYGIEPTPKDTYEKSKGDYDRYRCINLQNPKTIEFRIFRGTLRRKTFIATLQFVHALCNACLNISTNDIVEYNWYNFTEEVNPEEYTELVEYLKDRNLY